MCYKFIQNYKPHGEISYQMMTNVNIHFFYQHVTVELKKLTVEKVPNNYFIIISTG